MKCPKIIGFKTISFLSCKECKYELRINLDWYIHQTVTLFTRFEEENWLIMLGYVEKWALFAMKCLEETKIVSVISGLFNILHHGHQLQLSSNSCPWSIVKGKREQKCCILFYSRPCTISAKHDSNWGFQNLTLLSTIRRLYYLDIILFVLILCCLQLRWIVMVSNIEDERATHRKVSLHKELDYNQPLIVYEHGFHELLYGRLLRTYGANKYQDTHKRRPFYETCGCVTNDASLLL